MTLKIEIITDAARFAAIQQAWRQLWERSGAFVFQRHDWITGWISGVRDRRDIKLQIAVAWEGDQLCGAMPCAVHRRSGLAYYVLGRAAIFRLLRLSDRSGIRRPDILSLLWDSLDRIGGFDLINLQQVRPDAKCREFLDRLASDGGRLQLGDRSDRCMRIDNRWPDGEAFFRSLNKKRAIITREGNASCRIGW